MSGMGAGAGGAGANGASGPGNGGAGGNGGGAAGMVVLIAPTITYSGTVTGRLVQISGTDALDFIRGYYVD